jgi:hypothetical protein
MDPRDRMQSILSRIDGMLPRGAAGEGGAAARLGSATNDRLAEVAADGAAPSGERIAALEILAQRLSRESHHVPLLIELTGDAEPSVALAALRLIPAHDAAGTDHLLALCDSMQILLRDGAAHLLARRKERRLVPRLNAWLTGGDASARELAIDCLGWVLRPVDAILVLERLQRLGMLTDAENERVEQRLRALRESWGDLDLELEAGPDGSAAG